MLLTDLSASVYFYLEFSLIIIIQLINYYILVILSQLYDYDYIPYLNALFCAPHIRDSEWPPSVVYRRIPTQWIQVCKNQIWIHSLHHNLPTALEVTIRGGHPSYGDDPQNQARSFIRKHQNPTHYKLTVESKFTLLGCELSEVQKIQFWFRITPISREVHPFMKNGLYKHLVIYI